MPLVLLLLLSTSWTSERVTRGTKLALILEGLLFCLFNPNHISDCALSVVMYSNVVALLGPRGRRKDKLLCRVRNTRLGQELHKQLCCQGKIVIDMPRRGQNIAARV